MHKLTLLRKEGSKSLSVWRDTILIIDKSVKGIIVTLHNKNKKRNVKIISQTKLLTSWTAN